MQIYGGLRRLLLHNLIDLLSIMYDSIDQAVVHVSFCRFMLPTGKVAMVALSVGVQKPNPSVEDCC